MIPFIFMRPLSRWLGWPKKPSSPHQLTPGVILVQAANANCEIAPLESLLAIIANAHKLAAAYGAPKAVLATLSDPMRATDGQIAQLSRYVADESKMLQAGSSPDPMAMPAALRASGGSMNEFKEATELVSAVSRAQTFGQATGMVLAYRKRVRTAVLAEATIAADEDAYELSASSCWCRACNKDRTVGGLPYEVTTFITCPQCGNKRCPHASDHKYSCTGSNEPGQPGSVY